VSTTPAGNDDPPEGKTRMSYVDLHLHLLPGVDDGPADEEASLEHARRLVRDCVREAVATPHVGHPTFPLDVASIAARTERLQAALDAARIPLLLHPGGELHASAAATITHDELDLIAQGPTHARWVLLEAPFVGIDDAFIAGCRAIREKGFSLAIAHPERSIGFRGDGLRRLEPEIAAGAVLQVNVCSLLGDHGDDVRDAARWLIRQRMAYVLASDGHGVHRPQTLAAGLALAVGAGVLAHQAWRLTQANPAFLLRHGVPATPGSPPAGQRAWAPALSARIDATRRARQRLAQRGVPRGVPQLRIAATPTSEG
jgi:protein-tyrosine phosphatase